MPCEFYVTRVWQLPTPMINSTSVKKWAKFFFFLELKWARIIYMHILVRVQSWAYYPKPKNRTGTEPKKPGPKPDQKLQKPERFLYL